jgi:VanZ family protein
MASMLCAIVDRLTSQRARRVVFWVYTVALFAATHWPKVELPGPPNTDKVLHIVVFGAWTFLFAVAGYLRPIRRPVSLLAIGLIAAAWAGLDELLQEIPIIHRHATIKDYVANLIGVGAGLVAAVAASPVVETIDRDTGGAAEAGPRPTIRAPDSGRRNPRIW